MHCCRWALDRAACGIIRACQIASAHSLVCYVLVVLERLLKVIAGSVVVNGCCEHIPSELWLQGLCAFWAFSTSVAYFKYTCFLSLLALWHVFLFFLLLSFFSCVQTLYLLGIFLKLKHNFFFLVLCFANVFHLVCVVDHYLLLALYGNARHSHLRSELVVEGGSLFLCGVT